MIGTLKDSNFLGTLIAVCVYPKYDLMENIFSSRPEDFLKFGIYTCRFYVNEEWVDLITDTNIPCVRNNLTGIVIEFNKYGIAVLNTICKVFYDLLMGTRATSTKCGSRS